MSIIYWTKKKRKGLLFHIVMQFTGKCVIAEFAAFEKKVLIEELWVTESENIGFARCETENGSIV